MSLKYQRAGISANPYIRFLIHRIKRVAMSTRPRLTMIFLLMLFFLLVNGNPVHFGSAAPESYEGYGIETEYREASLVKHSSGKILYEDFDEASLNASTWQIISDQYMRANHSVSDSILTINATGDGTEWTRYTIKSREAFISSRWIIEAKWKWNFTDSFPEIFIGSYDDIDIPYSVSYFYSGGPASRYMLAGSNPSDSPLILDRYPSNVSAPLSFEYMRLIWETGSQKVYRRTDSLTWSQILSANDTTHNASKPYKIGLELWTLKSNPVYGYWDWIKVYRDIVISVSDLIVGQKIELYDANHTLRAFATVRGGENTVRLNVSALTFPFRGYFKLYGDDGITLKQTTNLYDDIWGGDHFQVTYLTIPKTIQPYYVVKDMENIIWRWDLNLSRGLKTWLLIPKGHRLINVTLPDASSLSPSKIFVSETFNATHEKWIFDYTYAPTTSGIYQIFTLSPLPSLKGVYTSTPLQPGSTLSTKLTLYYTGPTSLLIERISFEGPYGNWFSLNETLPKWFSDSPAELTININVPEEVQRGIYSVPIIAQSETTLMEGKLALQVIPPSSPIVPAGEYVLFLLVGLLIIAAIPLPIGIFSFIALKLCALLIPMAKRAKELEIEVDKNQVKLVYYYEFPTSEKAKAFALATQQTFEEITQREHFKRTIK